MTCSSIVLNTKAFFLTPLAVVLKVRLSMLGVFWHFLDLIWVGIFSLVFLVPLA